MKTINIPAILGAIFILGVIAVVIIGIFISFSEEKFDNPVRSYATVVGSRIGARGYDSGCEYKVNNEVYLYWGKYYNSTQVKGDRYLMDYEKNDPEKIKIYYYKPVFLQEDKTYETVGIITFIYRITKPSVSFEYWVDGFKYEKMQQLPPNYKEIYPNLQKGDTYNVKYFHNNPQRSIIYIE